MSVPPIIILCGMLALRAYLMSHFGICSTVVSGRIQHVSMIACRCYHKGLLCHSGFGAIWTARETINGWWLLGVGAFVHECSCTSPLKRASLGTAVIGNGADYVFRRRLRQGPLYMMVAVSPVVFPTLVLWTAAARGPPRMGMAAPSRRCTVLAMWPSQATVVSFGTGLRWRHSILGGPVPWAFVGQGMAPCRCHRGCCLTTGGIGGAFGRTSSVALLDVPARRYGGLVIPRARQVIWKLALSYVGGSLVRVALNGCSVIYVDLVAHFMTFSVAAAADAAVARFIMARACHHNGPRGQHGLGTNLAVQEPIISSVSLIVRAIGHQCSCTNPLRWASPWTAVTGIGADCV